MVKNLPVSVKYLGDAGSVPGSGRSPEGRKASHSSILAWRILRTEEPGGLQSKCHKELDMTEYACTHTHTDIFIYLYTHIYIH